MRRPDHLDFSLPRKNLKYELNINTNLELFLLDMLAVNFFLSFSCITWHSYIRPTETYRAHELEDSYVPLLPLYWNLVSV